MRDRIVGLEEEWISNTRMDKGCPWGLLENSEFRHITRALSRKHGIAESLYHNLFLSNGARICREVAGEHLETASWECSRAMDAVIFEKWVEKMLCLLVKELKEGESGDFVFYKKSANADLDHARGCHENYLMIKDVEAWIENSQTPKYEVREEIDPRINYLILFLITRQIISGAGGVMLYSRKGGRNRYEISPRTFFTDKVFGTRTTEQGLNNLTPRGRGIIHMKTAEPLADKGKYQRLHLIYGDSNMSEISNFLKVGTTIGILELLEEGAWDNKLQLRNPREAIDVLRAVSRDLTARNVPIVLTDGVARGALEIQEMICENHGRYLAFSGQGGEKAEINGRWREALECLKTDDEKIYGQLDWKIKQRLLHDYMAKRSAPISDPRVVLTDLQYHSPVPEQSFYYILKNRKGSKIETLVTEAEIAAANCASPSDNRARLRFRLQKLLEELELPYTAEWDEITFSVWLNGEIANRVLYMPNPFSSSISQLDTEQNREAIAWIDSLRINR